MDEKKIKIRVWHSSGSKFPGHVSIESFSDDGLSLTAKGDISIKMKHEPGIHASFWPKNVCEKRCQHENNIDHLHNAQEDINVEKHPAEDNNYGSVYELKELDVSAINAAFEAFQKNPKNWSLLGSSPLIKFFASNKEMQNCSGLVYLLLKTGGVDKFLSTWTWMKLGIREWAPSGKWVALGALPFGLFAGYGIARRAHAALFVKELDVLAALSWANPENITSEQELLAKQFRDKYSRDIVKHFTGWGDLGWILSVIDDFTGNFGLAISISITVLAIGYVAAAGWGSVSSFTVITPGDILRIDKELNSRQLLESDEKLRPVRTSAV